MNVYLKDWGRPMGIEPTIYLYRPELLDDDYSQFSYSVITCQDIKKALLTLVLYVPTETLIKELKIKGEE